MSAKDQLSRDETRKSKDTDMVSESEKNTYHNTPQTNLKQSTDTNKTQSHKEENYIQFLPNWINKPWMYISPIQESQYLSWMEEWQKIIYTYSNYTSSPIITLSELRIFHPFTNNELSKNLSNNQLITIIEDLVTKNNAIWMGNDKLSIYLKLKSDLEYASEIHQFMINNGYALDVITLFDIRSFNQLWSKIPENHLKNIIEVLISQNKAEWVGKNQDAIKFSI